MVGIKILCFVRIFRSENTENENAAKDTAIKPAKLSRGRAPKPLLPLGRKWGKKLPPPSTKAKDTASDKVDESLSDGASKEQVIICNFSLESSDLFAHSYFALLKVMLILQVNKDASPLKQADKSKSDNEDIFSEEEDATVQPPRPTRYSV